MITQSHKTNPLPNQSKKYFKKFTIITSSAIILILTIISLITVNEIINNYNEYEKQLLNKIEDKATYIDNLISGLKKQTEILTDQINYEYVNKKSFDYPVNHNDFFIQTDSVHYSMDNLPDSLKQQLGNLHGFGNYNEIQKRSNSELQRHLKFSPLLAAIHKQHPNVAWVYMLSPKNNFLNLYPFVSGKDVTYDPIYGEYDIVKMGTPSQNQNRELFITPAYLDAGGAGLMVSIGKPYYNNLEFMGVCGIDVTLKFISEYIKQSLSEGDEIFIINNKYQIVGHSNNEILKPEVVIDLKSSNPELLQLIEQNNATFLSGAKKYYTINFKNANWKLIFSTPNTSPLFLEINRYFILMILLLFTIVLVLSFVTYKFYVSPARKLTRYIEDQSQNIINNKYSVTPIWQYWFKTVGDSFQKSRDTIEYLDLQVNKKTEELQSAYDRLQIKKLELEESNNYKDRIFSVLSHDLRSSVNSLIAILDLFQKDYLTQQEFLTNSKLLSNDTKKVRIMMENLLKWSVNNLDSFRVNLQKVCLKDEIFLAINMLSSIAQNKQITISTQIDKIIDSIVYTDKGVIELVLRNLLMNAIKFSNRNSTIIVKVNTSKDDNFIIQIIDSGIGIPSSIQHKLFEAGRGIQIGTCKEKGTGLGLSLCMEFLHKIGGEIWFESTVGVGTKFSFKIPSNITRDWNKEKNGADKLKKLLTSNS